MVRLGDDHFVVSCGENTEHTEKYGEIIDITDWTAGHGFTHLMVYNGKANASRTRELAGR